MLKKNYSIQADYGVGKDGFGSMKIHHVQPSVTFLLLYKKKGRKEKKWNHFIHPNFFSQKRIVY